MSSDALLMHAQERCLRRGAKPQRLRIAGTAKEGRQPQAEELSMNVHREFGEGLK